jgi:hypothetical protein
MLEALVPYISPNAAPKPGSKTIWVDTDPVMSNYKTIEFQADLWLPVSVAAAANAIHDAAAALLSRSDMSRIVDRRERLAARKRELDAASERLAQDATAR